MSLGTIIKIHKSSVYVDDHDRSTPVSFSQSFSCLATRAFVLCSSHFCRRMAAVDLMMAAADAVRGHIITLTSHVNNWKFNIIFSCNV